ncbi:GNAT family N-acetyltransferase [Oleomonas cavernae]|uniref:GNAT family N-acetyltransferase n=1 Tax=Oleomonas cavernae TaxID=2320859 RepID=A0A418WHN7_9PROT|nr:GNAT family N-acetyltransferase [Oleomonas cavernae]RJF89547.1 GNAT family N-acetyltransferase [Oleomonas cavernae]
MTAARLALAGDIPAMAMLHAAAFRDAAWDEAMMARLLAMPGAFAQIAGSDGFALLRTAADELEVMTVAVAAGARRQGVARRLLEAGLCEGVLRGARTAFLEVAVDNPGAIALYEAIGFTETGRRRGYYRRPDGTAVDALVMARQVGDLAAGRNGK